MTRDAYKHYEYKLAPPADMLARVRAMAQGMKILAPSQTGTIKRMGAIGANVVGPDYEGDEDDLIVPIQFVREGWLGVPVPQGEYSMLPYIQPGDSLIFAPGSKMTMFVAVRLAGDTLPVCKKLCIVGGRPMLHSMNPDFADIPADGHEILGFLVGIVPPDMRMMIGPEEEGLNDVLIREKLLSRVQ